MLTARPSIGPIAAIVASLLVSPVAVAADEWTPFDVDPAAVCADGSAPGLFERVADPGRVVLYFEGGGACWSAETCDFERPNPLYASSSHATADSGPRRVHLAGDPVPAAVLDEAVDTGPHHEPTISV